MSGCSCKKSRCLQAYCNCFATNNCCDKNCKCLNCFNQGGEAAQGILDERLAAREKYRQTVENKRQKREEAAQSSPATSSEAGSVQVASPPGGSRVRINHNPDHCTCKKSKCVKKYCICFAKGRQCDVEKCKCVDCQNLGSHLVPGVNPEFYFRTDGEMSDHPREQVLATDIRRVAAIGGMDDYAQQPLAFEEKEGVQMAPSLKKEDGGTKSVVTPAALLPPPPPIQAQHRGKPQDPKSPPLSGLGDDRSHLACDGGYDQLGVNQDPPPPLDLSTPKGVEAAVAAVAGAARAHEGKSQS